ncbi:MAG: hypothetical protein HGB32_12045 [Geobacteraceae bacterium]|nr:hypothetical protein [Geobacteraceae bacterium]
MAALASGMADDFNNILTTVMGACSLIDKDDPNNRDLHQCVELIRTSAEHAAALSVTLMRAGAVDKVGANPGDHLQDSASAATSVRDKKSCDGIVSSDNKPGGVTS